MYLLIYIYTFYIQNAGINTMIPHRLPTHNQDGVTAVQNWTHSLYDGFLVVLFQPFKS